MHEDHHQPPVDTSTKIKSAFEAWNLNYQSSSPATGGRRTIDAQLVLARTRSLFPILDMFADANPIAKVVVSMFESLVNLEADRRENKLRVAAVLFAQTEMMSAFLEIYALHPEHPDPYTTLPPSQQFYKDLLGRVESSIRECGNTIDAYCKESRLFKFIKASEWGETLAEYIRKFESHRGEILLMLSLRTAKAVDSITLKLDAMRDSLQHHFTQREDWERKLELELAKLGTDKSWMEDDDELQRLVSITNDPLFDAPTPASKNRRNVDLLSALKESMHTSLDELCKRNSEIFYRKLDLQTEQLKNAVEMSAKYVIRELSGPYDRLWDKDLRELWKEMGWVFCVETQQFAQALYEYFSDRLSSPNLGEKYASRSSSGDAWTLKYLSTHARQISNAIDSDGSGYVKISEVNAFTAKMPDGWTLPQWCCCAALGTPYERIIYQNRINDVMDRLTLGQIQVQCDNLAHYAMFINGETIRAFSLLARGSPQKLDLDAPWKALAEAKVSQQDKRLRKDLLGLKFNIDAVETIRLLCGEAPIEDYILQLATLLLEHCLEIAQCCSYDILDTSEFSMMWSSLSVVKHEMDRRIKELKDIFSKQNPNPAVINERLEDYRGGIFGAYYHFALELGPSPDNPPIWDMVEVQDRLAILWNQSSGGESPSEPPSMIKGHLTYATWGDHIQSLPAGAPIPDPIPLSWNLETQSPAGTGRFAKMPRTHDFPIHVGNWCNGCHKKPITKQVCFTCAMCPYVDLCPSCYFLPPAEMDAPDHSDTHGMIKHTLFIPTAYRAWTIGLARLFLTNLYIQGCFDPAPDPALDEGEPVDVTRIPPCHICDEKKQGILFQCMEIACHIATDGGYFLCSDCEKTVSGNPCSPPEPEVASSTGNVDNSPQHQSWHTMLIIRPNVDPGNPWSSEEPSPRREVATTLNTLEARVAAVEDRLETMESKITGMIEAVLQKVETLLMPEKANLGGPGVP